MPLQVALPLESPEDPPRCIEVAMALQHKIRMAIQCHPSGTKEGLLKAFVNGCSSEPTAEMFEAFLREVIAEGLRSFRRQRSAMNERAKNYLARWPDGSYSNF